MQEIILQGFEVSISVNYLALSKDFMASIVSHIARLNVAPKGVAMVSGPIGSGGKHVHAYQDVYVIL